MNILDKIIETTRIRIQKDRARIPLDILIQRCEELPTLNHEFLKALAEPGTSFICEVKKASPSKGVIREEFPYMDIAKAYVAGGASCISVLTEPDFFLGFDLYLEEISKTVSLPILRKDFIIDPYQIYQSRLLGADAILLIRSVLEPEIIAYFAGIAEQLGMKALTEIHDKDELKSVLDLGMKLIGVNNRDLKTFEVDLENSIRLRELTDSDVLMVAESGIKSREDIIRLEQAGIDAVLVGETLMRSSDVRNELLMLKFGKEKPPDEPD